ncbi:peptidase M29 [Erythrobacter litoralis]|uniref:Peptidase M29 n=2 Tax=Erythrobacter litoralis TaxID=39960 RepID=A0A074M5M1_9SPHN|nr:peptidase M29 [Erythrobacter litoralis]
MLVDRIEAKWIDTFEAAFRLCEVAPGDEVTILSETQSRAINTHLAELALLRLGAKPFHIVMPTPAQSAPVPVRSTGSSVALQNVRPVLEALKASKLVVDLTVEGLMHADETPEILGGGSRILYISNEHPEALERMAPDASLIPRVLKGREMMQAARTMHVTSAAGTELSIGLEGARIGGNLGAVTQPGTLATWPGGICSCFPARSTVTGVLVLDEGDINITFKRYLEKPIRLVIEKDYVTAVEGTGADADLMRAYFEAWDDPEAYGTSHVGWGMNPGARWESLLLYDKGDVNGIESRAFAGNFLFSTGANPFANRHTLGHFDLPVRGCTITLDDTPVVVEGKLVPELA